jgi:hypothetical protein
MNVEKNYEVRLKVVGEVVRIGGHAADDELKVNAIAFDLGDLATVYYSSSQLQAKAGRQMRVISNFGEFAKDSMIEMLYLARDIDGGKFTVDRLIDAVKSRTLSSISLSGDGSEKLMAELNAKGLGALLPMIGKKKLH